ncbi:hypothetical protein VP1G_00183 [Cytospora mali]|uniref:Clr5 domain-containing protein n=1 Tax=Cytospora mali TaxID=578113 RepID=A0A194UMG3_CYTMA|nr:hypothetical protein VP1G_00183 [Valsa mali var. pyri (nom. inval.)]
MVRGRPRVDFDQHKDQIVQLYRDKTPWTRIEEILLTQHGCKVSARTIMDRFKEWDTALIRVRTDKTDELKDQIKAYWADRNNRPKTDEELHQKLLADGFTVSLTATSKIRNELKLFRRWDHKLGRVRPEAELDRRRRHRKQKGSVYTDAQLAPPSDVVLQDPVQPQPSQGPARPRPRATQPGNNNVPAARVPRQRRQALPSQPAQPPQPAQTAHPPTYSNQQPFGSAADQRNINKDA